MICFQWSFHLYPRPCYFSGTFKTSVLPQQGLGRFWVSSFPGLECHDLCFRFMYVLACHCHFHSMTSLLPRRMVWGEGSGVGVGKRDPDLTSLLPRCFIFLPTPSQPRSGLWTVCFIYGISSFSLLLQWPVASL